MKVAVLDDDKSQLQLIKQTLHSDGLFDNAKCSFFESGEQLLAAIKEEPFDLLILDRKVPDMSGDVVLQWLRQYGMKRHGIYTIAIMLTAMDLENDEVYSLQVGADDYITKPFTAEKLLLRIKRLLSIRDTGRESANNSHEHRVKGNLEVREPSILESHSLKFNDVNHSVTLKTGERVKLSAIEYELARLIVSNCGIALSRQEIYNQVWKDSKANLRAVDAYMHRLRTKLDLHIENGFALRMIYGFGYRLDCIGCEDAVAN